MKKNSQVVLLLMMCLICLFIAGCAGVITYDRLPKDAPKGYVEFYAEGVTQINSTTWSVDEKKDGKYKRATSFFIWSGEQRRKVAALPGVHTYRAWIGSASCEITVNVLEEMIIPIRVNIVIGNIEKKQNMEIMHYSISVKEEEPIPFIK